MKHSTSKLARLLSKNHTNEYKTQAINDLRQFLQAMPENFTHIAGFETAKAVLEGLLAGFDMGKALGINPSKGAHPKFDGHFLLLAAHYYLLKENGMAEKAAASLVAEEWKISVTSVRRFARIKQQDYLDWRASSRLARNHSKAPTSKDYALAIAEIRFISALIMRRPTAEALRVNCIALSSNISLVGKRS